MRVKHFAAFGSPNDGTIVPWNSSLFSFWAKDAKTFVDMKEQDIYINDTFGLRTLDEAGKLSLTAVDGIEHAQWLHNRTNFELHVLPFLT